VASGGGASGMAPRGMRSGGVSSGGTASGAVPSAGEARRDVNGAAGRFEAIAFDLLTALIDSWSLYARVTGSEELGRAWRLASLRRVTAQGDYRSYEEILLESATEAGVPAARAKRDDLVSRWGELKPWPEVPGVLTRLADGGHHRLAIVTNCSQRLAEIAAAATSGRFELVLSAERAGAYKTDPRAYRAALSALRLPPDRVLFVAGSAHDVPGASRVGMPVYWSNRQRLPVPAGGPIPLANEPSVARLPEFA
jgi:2-haloacid dehalogenase